MLPLIPMNFFLSKLWKGVARCLSFIQTTSHHVLWPLQSTPSVLSSHELANWQLHQLTYIIWGDSAWTRSKCQGFICSLSYTPRELLAKPRSCSACPIFIWTDFDFLTAIHFICFSLGKFLLNAFRNNL